MQYFEYKCIDCGVKVSGWDSGGFQHKRCRKCNREYRLLEKAKRYVKDYFENNYIYNGDIGDEFSIIWEDNKFYIERQGRKTNAIPYEIVIVWLDKMEEC